MNNPELPAFLGNSKLEYMEDILQKFYDRYYSVENYMNKIGISERELELIRNKLLCD